ncbi:MAG TPA: anti-sigma factor [Candidatus Dormibacteraeota bacterium]
MNCHDAELLLAALAVDGADETDLSALRRHLRDCAACRDAAAGLQRAADLLPLSVDLVEPPPELRSRLLSLVHAEAAGATAPVASIPWWRRAWARIPAARALTLGGALAAAVAVVLAVAWGTGWHQGGNAGAVSAFAVHGCGLTAQPNACATLTVQPSASNPPLGRGDLTVAGLAPIPAVDGRPTGVYEVWLITSDHHAEPAAFLTLQPDGHTWAATMPMDLSRHVALAMTEEPYPSGSATPTGAQVFQLTMPAAPRPL